jgi:hypothetical protein
MALPKKGKDLRLKHFACIDQNMNPGLGDLQSIAIFL